MCFFFVFGGVPKVQDNNSSDASAEVKMETSENDNDETKTRLLSLVYLKLGHLHLLSEDYVKGRT